MLFNSIAFALFLPLVFALYWSIGSHRKRAQNIVLILASFVFYGWWDCRFVALLLATTNFDYWAGLQLGRLEDPPKRRRFFALSIGLNLVTLAFFKYFNFFSQNFSLVLRGLGFEADAFTLQILLPIGISFYTFHSMSYVIDVYYRRRPACDDAPAFFAFISFFPLLVAGPIVRATWFLPQFQAERRFDSARASDGLRQILWGFFKKLVIADGCAHFVNPIFEQWQMQTGATLAAGAILFAFQIYGDFGGYSDIAIGTARLFGFHLLPNFRYPYFSRDIAEFWRRWHISLTSWFRDYVYIPLGGSRSGKLITIRNTVAVFLLSGFWHGASWTFIAWGMLHAAYFMPVLLLRRNRQNLDIVAHGRWLPRPGELLHILSTFALVCFAWIFFRAADMAHAVSYMETMCFSAWGTAAVERRMGILIAFMLIVEWINRGREHGLQLDWLESRMLRWLVYMLVALLTYSFGAPAHSFIYFQF